MKNQKAAIILSLCSLISISVQAQPDPLCLRIPELCVDPEPQCRGRARGEYQPRDCFASDLEFQQHLEEEGVFQPRDYSNGDNQPWD